MAFVCLYDPYEWVDPEKGRQGIIVHSSQFDSLIHKEFVRAIIREPITWSEMWELFDDRSASDPGQHQSRGSPPDDV